MTYVFFAIHVYHSEKIFCKNFSWMLICSLCYSGEWGAWRWWKMCSWFLFRVEGNSGHWGCGKLWLMSEIITVTLNKKGHLTCWWNRSSHEQVCVHSLSPSFWDANIFFVTEDVSRDYARVLHMEIIISANYSIAGIRIWECKL